MQHSSCLQSRGGIENFLQHILTPKATFCLSTKEWTGGGEAKKSPQHTWLEWGITSTGRSSSVHWGILLYSWPEAPSLTHCCLLHPRQAANTPELHSSFPQQTASGVGTESRQSKLCKSFALPPRGCKSVGFLLVL